MSLMYTHLYLLNHPTTTKNYTLSLHDALPISILETARTLGINLGAVHFRGDGMTVDALELLVDMIREARDRKSTRLNSSHVKISYAVFCLKKKKQKHNIRTRET